MGGRIVGAVLFGRIISSVSRTVIGYMVQELHSTKGWRPVTRVGTHYFTGHPRPGFFYWQDGCGPSRGAFLKNVVPEKALMRHAWYRKKKHIEAQLAAARIFTLMEEPHAPAPDL